MDNGINDSFLERFVWNVFTNAYQMKIKGADDMRRRNVCARELRRQAARGAFLKLSSITNIYCFISSQAQFESPSVLKTLAKTNSGERYQPKFISSMFIK